MSGVPQATEPEPRNQANDTSARRIGRTLRRWWLAYMDWRLQRLTMDRLRCMSDRQLCDMGLSRSQIEAAIRGPADRRQLFNGRFP